MPEFSSRTATSETDPEGAQATWATCIPPLGGVVSKAGSGVKQRTCSKRVGRLTDGCRPPETPSSFYQKANRTGRGEEQAQSRKCPSGGGGGRCDKGWGPPDLHPGLRSGSCAGPWPPSAVPTASVCLLSREDTSTEAWPPPGQEQGWRGPTGHGFSKRPGHPHRGQEQGWRGRRSQLLKWKQVGSLCLLSPLALLGALGLLLFFSCSVLRPGGSQDPDRFCLRAGPLLFIRRKATSGIRAGAPASLLAP